MQNKHLFPILLFLILAFGPKLLGTGESFPVTVQQQGLGVLIIEESDPEIRAKLTKDQLDVMLGTAPGSLREYCKTNAPNGFFVIDKDSDVTYMPDWVKQVWTRERKGLPWSYFINGKAGYEGPMPATTEQALTLAKKYGVVK